jgi:hypothetical protein
MVGVWQPAGERGEQLRTLAGYDTADLAEPPLVDEFASAHLGSGVRVRCLQKGPRRHGSPVGRARDRPADKGRVRGPRLAANETPAIDAFARAMRLVPKQW